MIVIQHITDERPQILKSRDSALPSFPPMRTRESRRAAEEAKRRLPLRYPAQKV